MGFNSVPNEWIDYSKVGTRIKDTRFIAFKVPLREQICYNLEDISKRFTPSDLLAALESFNFELRCIIDLTLTTRYYSSAFFTDRNIKYAKIKMEGQGKVPPDYIVEEFFELVDDFVQNHNDDTLIGVHCTHGVNRTGYLICRYLIDRLGWEPKDAVEAFEKARGHPFDHESYRSNLLDRNATPAIPSVTKDSHSLRSEHIVKEVPQMLLQMPDRYKITPHFNQDNYHRYHRSAPYDTNFRPHRLHESSNSSNYCYDNSFGGRYNSNYNYGQYDQNTSNNPKRWYNSRSRHDSWDRDHY